MNTAPLERIGLTPGEIKVYLALLRLGTTTAGPIAKEAGVARSKLYDILDRLAKKGMASHHVKGGTQYFAPTEPSRIIDLLKNREAEIQSQQEEVKKLLPVLDQEYTLRNVQKDAEVFEGLEGLKNAREKYIRLLQRGDVIHFFGVPLSAYARMEAYYQDWNERRIKKGILSRTIFNDEARSHPYVQAKQSHRLTEIRFMPEGIITHAWTEIYQETVVIALNHKTPLSIVIENKYVAESYLWYFTLLWKASKK